MTVGYTVERFPVLSQTFVRNEVEELRRQGIDVVVARLYPGDVDADVGVPTIDVRAPHDGRLRLLSDHLHYAIHRPLRYLRFLRAVRSLPTERDQIAWRRLPRVARQLTAAGVDRLHAHFAWGGAALALALGELTGWPWAMTMHARDIFTERRNLRVKLAAADLLITVCDYNLRYLRDELGVQRPVAKVVCGARPPEHVPSLDDRPHAICFVGRMVEKKGVDLLLRAFAAIAGERSDIDLHLVGDGPMLADMQALAAELALGDVAHFHGALPHQAALQIIERSRILCLPARVAADGDVDSMPLVVKEAMARGTAVVATAAGGVAEMVDGVTGLLVPPDDVDGLAKALAALIDNDDKRKCVAKHGQRKFQSEFRLTQEVTKLRALLATMSPAAGGPRPALARMPDAVAD
ncbi:MAG TPA: glycosyltransferase family 4 protein [Mycobacteriales bacterium]|nr:glycosyltransferase family 4 protein [Mycobacteriales bacterium]